MVVLVLVVSACGLVLSWVVVRLGLPGCGDCALFSLVCLRFGFSGVMNVVIAWLIVLLLYNVISFGVFKHSYCLFTCCLLPTIGVWRWVLVCVGLVVGLLLVVIIVLAWGGGCLVCVGLGFFGIWWVLAWF